MKVSPSTVSDYVARAKLAGQSSPLPPNCDDAALERLLRRRCSGHRQPGRPCTTNCGTKA